MGEEKAPLKRAASLAGSEASVPATPATPARMRDAAASEAPLAAAAAAMAAQVRVGARWWCGWQHGL